MQCLFGSNPHSNADFSSRSLLFFFYVKVAKIITTIDSRIVIVAIVTILFKFCYYNLQVECSSMHSLYIICFKFIYLFAYEKEGQRNAAMHDTKMYRGDGGTGTHFLTVSLG